MTFRIPIRPTGGLDTRQDPTGVLPSAFRKLTNKFMGENKAGIITRPGYARFNTGGAIATYTTLMGLYDFTSRAGTQYLIAGSENSGGTAASLYQFNSGTSVFDSIVTAIDDGRFSFAQIGTQDTALDELFFCGKNQNDAVKAWEPTLDVVRDLGLLAPDKHNTTKSVIKASGDLTDFSVEAGDNADDTDVEIGGMTTSNTLYVALPFEKDDNGKDIYPTRVTGLIVQVDDTDVNAVASTSITVEYAVEVTGGISWVAIAANDLTDDTSSGGVTLSQTGYNRIHWPTPGNWAKSTIWDNEGYWARITVNDTLTATVNINKIFWTGRAQGVYLKANQNELRHSSKINDWDDNTHIQFQVGGTSGTLGAHVNDQMNIYVPAIESGPFDAVFFKMKNFNGIAATISSVFRPTETSPDDPFPSFVDATETGGFAFGQDGILSWERTGEWIAQTHNVWTGDYWRMSFNLTSTVDDTTDAFEIVPLYNATVYFDETTFIDYTPEAASAATNDVTLDSLSKDNGYLYFGIDAIRKFAGVRMNVGEANGAIGTMWAEYWNGLRWAALEELTDGTESSGSTLGSTGSNDITWVRPADWRLNTVWDQTRFWMRFKPTQNDWDSPTSLTTADFIQSVIPVGNYVASWQGFLFVADVTLASVRYRSSAYYSKITSTGTSEPDDFTTLTDFIDLTETGEPITGIAPYGQYLLIFTTNTTWLIEYNPGATVFFKKTLIHSSIGCISHYGIVEAEEFIAFPSRQGWYAYIKGPGKTGIDSIEPIFIGSPMDGVWNGNDELTAIEGTRKAEMVGTHHAEKRQIIWLVTSDGNTAHDEAYVWDYGNSTIIRGDEKGDQGNYVWSKYTFGSDMEAIGLYQTATGTFSLMTGDANGFVYKHDGGVISDRDSSNTEVAIQEIALTGFMTGGDRYNALHKMFPQIKAWGRQNADFNGTAGIYLDYGRSAFDTSNMSLWETSGVDTDTRVGFEGAVAKAAAFEFTHNTVSQRQVINKWEVTVVPYVTE